MIFRDLFSTRLNSKKLRKGKQKEKKKVKQECEFIWILDNNSVLKSEATQQKINIFSGCNKRKKVFYFLNSFSPLGITSFKNLGEEGFFPRGGGEEKKDSINFYIYLIKLTKKRAGGACCSYIYILLHDQILRRQTLKNNNATTGISYLWW